MDLTKQARTEVWRRIEEAAEAYYADVASLKVFPAVTQSDLERALSAIDFSKPMSPLAAIDFVVKGLREWHLQTSSPAYFGVFNPRPAAMAIAGEWLAAVFNPQLASWTSSPFAIEMEQSVLRWWAQKLGLPGDSDRIFTHGGMEANLTAVLTALTRAFPDFPKKGLRGLDRQPVLYVSAETHHSFLKAARLCGLGTEAVREIPVDDKLRMRADLLESAIFADRDAGAMPFLAVGTAGSTSAGVIDDLERIAAICNGNRVSFHVDAAWGGAAVLLPEMAAALKGIERADSLTLDAHKWLAVPMTAGIFFQRHRGLLDATFRVDDSPYMPADSVTKAKHQPYHQSMSWSRRFLGLKLFLAMAVAGEEGYRETLRHQVKMGDKLRELLKRQGWKIVNETPLPVVCFLVGDRDPEEVAKAVAAAGKSWITTTKLNGVPVCRAGVANFATQESDLETLVSVIAKS